MTSASTNEKNCTFLIGTEKSTSVSQDDVCRDLEKQDVTSKIEGLKNAITGMISGEAMPKVLMTVIR